MEGERNSIKNKKEYLEDFAKKNGFRNIRHFTDYGVSGITFEREGFQKNPHLIIDEEAAKVVRRIYQMTEHELTMYENTRADLKMLLAEGGKDNTQS